MSCPFCEPDPFRIIHQDASIVCLWDGFPVTAGHALIMPRRHVATWFDASRAEQIDLLDGIEIARREIESRYSPDGFNIGINLGEAAGQTIPHLHIHVIPRYRGDVPDPRGGVRYVIPEKANYLEGVREASPYMDGDASILGNESNPLLPAFLNALSQGTQLDIAVAFVTEAGLGKVESHFRDLVDPGGRHGVMRFLTGDYLDVTEPRALRRLLDFSEEYGERADIRVFETSRRLGFHPKAYLIHKAVTGATAFIGSSNLTSHALERGLEWNQRIDGDLQASPLREVLVEFERLFEHQNTKALSAEWIDQYEARREAAELDRSSGIDPVEEPKPTIPEPHGIQEEALDALNRTRMAGNKAGLVVMATGLGKTWLAAFDSVEFDSVLFVAHREEILHQAMQTFRRIRPDARLGVYAGGRYDQHADVLFASVQTLSRMNHLRLFAPDRFDYIVVDEFHHAAASTYRKLIDHFDPKFMLGLTATPERSDGGDLLALCGENLVFRCDLVDGINRELLSRFKYYGVPDDVDFANIPWRSGKFDLESLENEVITAKRAASAFDQWVKRGQSCALAFCVSKRHADYMANYFVQCGVSAVAVHSGADSAPRTLSLEQLASGQLKIIFAVDMFNEGVDVPAIDTVIMLRPTESKILWLQQFGRGLRRSAGKTHLAVIDFIGNHRTFLQVPMILLPGAGTKPGELTMALQRLEQGELELPLGCSVEYDLEALNILKALARPAPVGMQVASWYRSFRELHGRRPFASEAFHEGYDPRAVRVNFGSWINFVKSEGDLSEAETQAYDNNKDFFDSVEITPMSKSYKMLVLQAMVASDKFPGAIGIDDLANNVSRIASRSQLLAKEMGQALTDMSDMRRLLEENPIKAWCGGLGMGGEAYFDYGDGMFATRSLAAADREAMNDLTREIVDWRLAQYLNGLHGELHFARQIICKVSHSGGNPLLFLPDRNSNPGIPTGWTQVIVNGEIYEANFVKIAVNVIRVPGEKDNVLPSLITGFFGSGAGLPGTMQRVKFEFRGDNYTLAPLLDEAHKPKLWQEYMRQEIAPLWGLEFSTAKWNQGFLVQGEQMFLLVSLDKDGMAAEHKYEDEFLSPDEFQWISQNRTRQESASGKQIRDHGEQGIDVHLFVREKRKTPVGKAAPFVYCGDVSFEDWEGAQPITVRWLLENPLPPHLVARFIE